MNRSKSVTRSVALAIACGIGVGIAAGVAHKHRRDLARLVFVGHNRGVRFAKSARKHLIGKGRARYVLDHPFVIVPVPPIEVGRDEMLIHLGDDHTGRALEVGGFRTANDTLLVAHVMDLRPKFRPLYEQGKAFHAREEGKR